MNKPYRPNAGIILMNDEGSVLIGKRLHTDLFAWQFPQGGIDDNETPFQAALRELREETGIHKIEYVAESQKYYQYDYPKNAQTPRALTYRGQKQKWFLFRYIGENVFEDLKNQKDQEFSDFKWEKLENVPPLVIPFKQEIYKQLAIEFSPLIKEELERLHSLQTINTYNEERLQKLKEELDMLRKEKQEAEKNDPNSEENLKKDLERIRQIALKHATKKARPIKRRTTAGNSFNGGR